MDVTARLDVDRVAVARSGEITIRVELVVPEGRPGGTVRGASLLVRPESDVQPVRLVSDLPSAAVAGGVTVEFGKLRAGERRTLVVALGVPAIATPGPAQVATLELRYVALPGLVEHTVILPVAVDVVAAGAEEGHRRGDRAR